MYTRPSRTLALLVVVLLALPACGAATTPTPPTDPAEAAFSATLFTVAPSAVDNPYFPLVPGRVQIYQAHTEDGVETIVEEVLGDTRLVAGVPCAVVRVRAWLGELLIEDAEDWYAQDDVGNVWYLGETVVNYEYDDQAVLTGTNSHGSWETNADVASVGANAVAGIIMKATPTPGDTYAQEYYPGEAEDMGAVEALGVTAVLSGGTSYSCLKTRDWNPLVTDSTEYKYYAPGVGLVLETNAAGDERSELLGVFDNTLDSLPDFSAALFGNPTILDNPYLPWAPGTVSTFEADTEDGLEVVIIEVLPGTRTVNGVECVRVRDRVYLDAVLIEDTEDWYAQDDAGNVWYLGEAVINYEFDDDGNALGSTDEGSWEAGVDGAVAGIVMHAVPTPGPSYRQEFWEDEAEDMAVVLAVGVTVTTADATYTNCVKTLDWTPLGPQTVEIKYYAPGVGFVLEEQPATGERLERVLP